MANKLSEIDWFKWKGVSCVDYGIHVLTQPTIVRPVERVDYQDIPARSGSLAFLEGENIYDDITMECGCIIESTDRIMDICGWLKGYGTVEFAARSNGFYRGRVANQVSFDKVVQGNPHRAFNLQFRCKPFFYLHSGNSAITLSSNPQTLVNPGNIPSEPLIKLTGTGSDQYIMCGGATMLITGFTGIGSLYLDCEEKMAYSIVGGQTTLMGGRIQGNWIQLSEGNSYFAYSSGISSVEITPRWRCI